MLGWRMLGVIVWLFVGLFVWANPLLAKSPLPLPGKSSVYQRVVSHPGAVLYAGPEAGAQKLVSLRTFTVLYIYGRSGDKIEVGVNTTGADGWIDANLVTEWPQAITMLFTDRMGRDPVLFFKTHDDLVKTCQAESVSALVSKYLARMRVNPAQADPVVATEPLDTAVAQKNFYLLPVLSIDSQFQDLKLVEVASLDPGTSGEQGSSPNNTPPNDRDLRIGFAFVIDTTISMGPYIQQTTALIRNLYNALEKSKYADNMAFAVVAFRSSVRKTPGLEYTAKVICDFTTVKDRKRLEDALKTVEEAKVSSHDINEDSFAGVLEAAEKLSWDKFGSRVMLMVTDAGPLRADDPEAKTKLTPDVLKNLLKEKRIYVTCAHVRTKKNSTNTAYAAKNYQRLTLQDDKQASYIAIDATNAKTGAESFQKTAKVLANSYERLLTATATGQFLKKPSSIGQKKRLSPEEEARRIAETTGYAMQLQFYGDQQKTRAPKVVRAWIADADLARLESAQGEAPVLACEPAVLLTKAQLSKLYEQIKLLLEASEEAFLNGKTDLFAQIKSAAGMMSRDPKQFSLNPEQNLLENNLLDEVIADLPYKSQIATMTQQDWENMSTGARQRFISRLKSLLERYDAYDRDAANWERFGTSNPNDSVYRVPLSMLP
ncbi:MAG: VWA domain-containing protein [Desulfovibrio sp.]|nr:VWA domain-containing protein [Desulfovibrio sp.]